MQLFNFTPKVHKNNFDFLRFIFAFIVVVSHTVSLSGAASIKFLEPYFDTHLSVTGFFIISGFLITQSFDKTCNLLNYFSKRANRILPAYFFVIVISALTFSFFSNLSMLEYFSNTQLYKYLASNFIFLNFLQPCLPGVFAENNLCAVNGALWTIKVEVTFYIILPFIILLGKKFKRPIVLFVFLYLLGLFYQGGLLYFIDTYPASKHILETLLHQMPGFLTYFVAGIALYKYFEYYSVNKTKLILLAIIDFLIEYHFKLEILLPISFAILIVSFAFGVKYLNDFGKNGDISYGIYIYHFPFIQLLISLSVFDYVNPFLMLIIIPFCVILIAMFSWSFVEKRFIYRFRGK